MRSFNDGSYDSLLLIDKGASITTLDGLMVNCSEGRSVISENRPNMLTPDNLPDI